MEGHGEKCKLRSEREVTGNTFQPAFINFPSLYLFISSHLIIFQFVFFTVEVPLNIRGSGSERAYLSVRTQTHTQK